MIENYLLEELVTFSENKTLAKTAAQLRVTQPTVTRGMQKLESELNVKLFDRQPNKISLTKTGNLAAHEAKKLLVANQDFVTHIQNFARTQQTIMVGSNAPGPLVVADQLAQYFNLKIDRTFVKPRDVIATLENNQYTFCFTNHEIQTDQVESLYVGTECLYVNLDQFMFLAGKRAVSFKELRGLSFVVLNDIGPWKQIIQDNIPAAKFLYQAERDALTEITRYANFPYFSTNVTKYEPQHEQADSDRVTIPITDGAAQMPFYVAYLKTQRPRLQPVFKKLIELWPAEKGHA
jgi:hypothetical protein